MDIKSKSFGWNWFSSYQLIVYIERDMTTLLCNECGKSFTDEPLLYIHQTVSRKLSDISCQIRHLSDWTTVRSDNCQWGQLSVETTVSGDYRQWRQLSVGTAVSGPTVSGNCKCFPGTETTVRSYSFRADNCKILQFQGGQL